MDKLSEGIDLYLAGDYHAAIRKLQEYIQEGGSAAGTAYYHIGLAYSDLQKLPEAGENLAKAISLEPKKSMYHYRIGVVYYRLMVLDKAIEHLKRSIELNPEHLRSIFILGTAYFRRGNIKKASETFTSLISASPDFADAYYRRALCSFHEGNMEKTKSDLEKALEISKEHNYARLKLARLEYGEGNFHKAVENCEIIFKNGIRDYVFLKFFIDTLIKSGDTAKAEKIGAEALLLYPYNMDIQNLFGKDDFENY